MGDSEDPFEGLVLDEDFVKKGAPEPPAHTRPDLTLLHPSRARAAPTPSAPQPTGRRPRQRRPRLDRPASRIPLIFGVSWIFLVLIALCAGSAYASWRYGSSHIAVFGFVISGWLLSLSLHEFAHASAAFVAGDRSVAAKGYLTLDLRRYVHPVMSFLLPVLFVILGGIGLPGGAVWIDGASLRSRYWRSATSLAGPFANALCAAACFLPFDQGWANARHFEFWAGVAFLGFLQLWALLLNLLPIPGLDGWGALEPFLPSHVVVSARRVQPFAFLILLFVVLSSATVGDHLRDLLDSIEGHFNVPSGLASYGYYLMKFWQS